MIVLRELRRRAHLIVGPALGIAATGYFAYHLVEGDRGLIAWLRLTQEIRTESAKLEAVRAQRQGLDLKVSNLKPDHLDPDLLDERVRATLNFVAPGETVIMQPATSRCGTQPGSDRRRSCIRREVAMGRVCQHVAGGFALFPQAGRGREGQAARRERHGCQT